VSAASGSSMDFKVMICFVVRFALLVACKVQTEFSIDDVAVIRLLRWTRGSNLVQCPGRCPGLEGSCDRESLQNAGGD
jgi:hypothetical protein